MRFLNTHDVITDLDRGVTASDGVRLSVDLYRPAGAEPLPAIVVQTPYDNNRIGGEDTGAGALPSPAARYRGLAALGFMVASIDTRGRGDSGGTFVPFSSDGLDGAAVVERLRTSEHVDGRIGVLGTGYGAYAALATAAETEVDSVLAWSPPALSPETSRPPFVDGVPSMLWFRWLHLKGGRSPAVHDPTNWTRVARDNDLGGLAAAVGRTASEWDRWLDPKDRVDIDFDAVDAPVLLATGWFDPAAGSTLGAWKRLRHRSTTELVVGPWGASAARRAQSTTGGIDWGPSAAVDPLAETGEWFSRTLRDGGLGGASENAREASRARTRLFLTGANEWSEADRSWPGESKEPNWNLTARSGANTRAGDGALLGGSPDDARESTFDEFIHNAGNPVPWQPSASGEPALGPSSGPLTLDPWFLTRRDDVLCYVSTTAQRPLIFSGEPRAQLLVSQDVMVGDWFVLLEDVFVGGESSVVLSLGAARLTITAGDTQELSPRRVDVLLSPAHHELQPGHALRVSVTASLWPLFHPRSTNPTGPSYSRRRVHHGGEQPSRLVLPLG